jgi:hypothetical protein
MRRLLNIRGFDGSAVAERPTGTPASDRPVKKAGRIPDD